MKNRRVLQINVLYSSSGGKWLGTKALWRTPPQKLAIEVLFSKVLKYLTIVSEPFVDVLERSTGRGF